MLEERCPATDETIPIETVSTFRASSLGPDDDGHHHRSHRGGPSAGDRLVDGSIAGRRHRLPRVRPAGDRPGAGQLWERSRWDDPVRTLARNLAAFNEQPNETWDLPSTPTLADLIAPVRDLQGRYLSLKGRLDSERKDALGSSDSGEMAVVGPLDGRMTRSGSYERRSSRTRR